MSQQPPAAESSDAETPDRPAGPSALADIPVYDDVIFDRSDPQFLDRAFDLYRTLHRRGPLVQVRHYPRPRDEATSRDALAGTRAVEPVLFVGGYDAVQQALGDPHLAVSPFALLSPEQRAGLPPPPPALRPILQALFLLDPPDHTRLRRLVQPSFAAAALDRLRPRVQRLTDALLDQAEREAAARGQTSPDRQMDLVQAFAHPLPVAVISDMLGIPDADRAQVAAWTAVQFDTRDPAKLAQTFVALGQFGAYLRDLFARRRSAPQDDLISQLVQEQQDGDKLSEDELLSIVVVLYVAGHITTVNLIGNSVAALLLHPDQATRLRADPAWVPGAVEETLRFWGPLEYSGSVRVALQPTVIAGIPLPRGTKLLLGLASANRDPLRFSDPDTFDITRADAHRHVAFGRGIHLCLGAPLARIEAQIALQTLIRRFPALRLAHPDQPLVWGTAGGMRGLGTLPVLF